MCCKLIHIQFLLDFFSFFFLEPEDAANAVLYLASEKAGMIHGHSLPVEGGMLAV